MLEQKVILYDDSCPMCKLYTQGFVRFGILTPEHRVGLAHAEPAYTAGLDLNRARHEIPLLDVETGAVTYGMEALFLLIRHRFPIFTSLFRNSQFRACVYNMYQIVTYNRRVIAGCAAPRDGFNCAPDFNRAMRTRYLWLATVTSVLLLGGITATTLLAHQPWLAGLILACAGIQGARMGLAFRVRCFWDRLGSLATDQLLYVLLLLPSLLPLPLPARWANFVLAAAITALDAVRRERNCQGCLCGSKPCRRAGRGKSIRRRTG